MNPYQFLQNGNQAFAKGDYESALSWYLQAEAGIRDDESPLANLYGSIGNVYGASGQRASAIVYFEKAMRLLRRLEDYERLGITYVNIGNLYSDDNDLGKAVHYYKQAALLLEEGASWEALSVLFCNISLMAQKQEDFSEAESYAQKAWKFALRLNQAKLKADTLHRLAKAKDGLGCLDEALNLSQRAGRFYKEIQDALGYAAVRYHQAGLHEAQGAIESAVRCLKEVVAIDQKYKLPKYKKNKARLEVLQAQIGAT